MLRMWWLASVCRFSFKPPFDDDQERNMGTGWRRFSGMLLVSLLMISLGQAEEKTARASTPPRRVVAPRHTLKELRDQNVVKQQQDYSCGTAALATLMIYYFGDHTSEAELITILTSQLTPDELRLREKNGLSLLDLKRVAEAKGYQAAGFTLTLEQLKQLAAPVMVFVHPLGYKHFAVLRGIDRGRVYLADPSRGNLRMSLARFAKEWGNIIFVLGKAGEADITTYPLALPHPDRIQPELMGITELVDPLAFPIHSVVRSQQLE
jgi:predicted double-glycine peptidase